MNPISEEDARRFWSKVSKTEGGCWTWEGARDKKGYGRFRLGHVRRTVLAHRVAFRIAKSDPGEALVCHHCDNPPCVNPDHLYAGTATDNAADMVRRGRATNGTVRGITHGNAVLDDAAVLEMRKAVASGESQASVSRRFGVTLSTANGIVTGKAWRHVGGPLRAPRDYPAKHLKRGLAELVDGGAA